MILPELLPVVNDGMNALQMGNSQNTVLQPHSTYTHT